MKHTLTNTASFAAWAADPDAAILDVEFPFNGYSSRNFEYKVDFPTITAPAVNAPKIIHGNDVRLYTQGSNPLTWVGSDGPGPSNPEMIRWENLHLRDQGIYLRNANFASVTGATVANAPFGFKATNLNSGGQGEHNEASLRILNCDEGVVLGAGSGNSSHRGWDMHAVITGTPKPFTLGPGGNLYGGQFRLQISTTNGMSNPNAAVCLDGFIHGAHFDILIENEAQIGIALGDPLKNNWPTRQNEQGYIRAHFVHEVTHTAIFDGPMDRLPPYRFTYGNPANGNHTRPAWVCSDGEVWETSRP